MKKLAILGIIALAHTAQAGYLEDGNSYFKNNNYPKAEQMYLKAIKENDGEIEAMYNLGTLYYEQNKFDKAKEMFLKAIQKGHVKAMYNLGILYYNQNDRINAKKYVKQASDLDYEEAQEVYKKMLQAGY